MKTKEDREAKETAWANSMAQQVPDLRGARALFFSRSLCSYFVQNRHGVEFEIQTRPRFLLFLEGCRFPGRTE